MKYPDLKEHVLAWDLETKDPLLTKKGKRPGLGPGCHRHYLEGEDSRILCVSISDSHTDYCFPSNKETWNWLNSIQNQHLWVAHNGLYDGSWSHYEGFRPNYMADTMGLVRLLHEDRLSYSLDNCANDFLGIGKKEDEISKWCKERKLSGKPQEHLWKMIEEGFHGLVYKYAMMDTRITYDLYTKLIPEVKRQNLTYIWEIEKELLPILVRMNHKGLRIDNEHRIKKIDESLKVEKELYSKIVAMVGCEVNVNSSKQLAPVFDRLKLSYSLTDKGNPSFKADDLLPYGVEPDENYLPHLIVQYKKMQKLRRDFLEKLELFMVKGRVHPTIYPFGTKTGRPTSQAPNIFQIPKRGRGKEICRPLFIPEEGEIFISADVASQELRVFAHYSRGEGAQKYRDKYNDESIKYDMHMDNAETAGCDRNKAKTIGLGVLFGMGKNKLASNLGLGQSEGMEILERFHHKNPSFMETSKAAQRYAEKFGYIRELSGRKRRFTRGEGAYKALNFLTQGTSASQLKIAIVQANRERLLDKFNLYMWVYDEVDLSVKVENMPYVMRFKEIIETCLPELKVKMLLEIEYGKSWGDLKEWK